MNAPNHDMRRVDLRVRPADRLAGGHGVHENGRFLAATHPVLAEELGKAGYQTGAGVSAYVLAKRFGLARGFAVYDDGLPEGGVERAAEATTDLALTQLRALRTDGPVFLWVHYFDAHAPYAPPAPFRDRFADRPYTGEVAYADAQMGRLVDAFRDAAKAASREATIIVTADHGEGLGDHGEAQHGNLVYQSTMHVPLVVSGPGVAPGEVATPVSIRRIFHTALDWAGRPSPESLRAPVISSEVIVGEARGRHGAETDAGGRASRGVRRDADRRRGRDPHHPEEVTLPL